MEDPKQPAPQPVQIQVVHPAAHRATLAALAARAEEWRKATAPDAQRADYADNLTDDFARWIASLPPEARQDSWSNVLTGHGTGRDKTTATTFQNQNQLPFPTLEALYHNEDLAARIVDAEPEQVWREGFDIHLVQAQDDPEEKQDAAFPGASPFPKAAAPPPKPGVAMPAKREFGELEDELAEELRELDAVEQFTAAQIWARLYGGSAIFVGANDGGASDKPLNEDRVRSVDFLHVLDRYSLWPASWYADPTSPKFAKPETYRIFRPVTGGFAPPINSVIHETRLIVFPGARTTIRKKMINFGWDDSTLQRVYQVLTQFGLSWAAATHLLSDAAQGVYKVKNLLDMIAGQNKDALLERMALVDETRSTARMLMVDADEESFERTPTPFAGIPDMLDRVVQRLAAAARMPVTVLMGISPGGLNATGASDMQQWYDRIRTVQTSVAGPRMKRLVGLMLAARGRKDLEVSVKFHPLESLNGLDEATRRKTIADTDAAYITAGVLLEEEVRASRFGGDGYNSETTIDDSLTGEALQAIKDARAPVDPLADPNADPNGDPVQPNESTPVKPAGA